MLARSGRRQPYTVAGVKRLACYRCGVQASQQWQVCADGNLFRPICTACDVELNELVLRWMGHPDTVDLIADYKSKMIGR